MGAFERLLAIVRAFVDGERACDGERFAAARIITQIRLCQLVLSDGLVESGSSTHFLEYVAACAVVKWQPPKSSACRLYIGTAGGRYATR